MTYYYSNETNSILAGYINSASICQVLFLSPDVLDTTAGANSQAICAAGGFGSVSIAALRTNTASQIKIISQQASTSLQISTHGWVDTRGRVA